MVTMKSSGVGAKSRSRQLIVFVSLLFGLVVGSTTLAADDYSSEWGPEIGSQLPVLEAYDQSGTLRTLENLSGEHGLLLFLSRSTDW